MADHLLHPRNSGTQRRPCNTTGYLARPLVSALIQTFGDSGNSAQLAARLHTIGSTELLVNADSRNGINEWLHSLNGPSDYLLVSPNVHEIRAYNRLARMARGDFLLLLQGDHCLPQDAGWLRDGLALFDRFPRLGLIGGQMGFNQVPYKKIAENVSWGGPDLCRPIPSATILAPHSTHEPPDGTRRLGTARHGRADTATSRSVPFMFVAGVNIGPLLIRREAFLRVGGFDESFSCVGEPGIQLDTELSLQLWRQGYQVGLWYSAVSNGVGGRKTRTNRVQKQARNLNDRLNGRRCERLFRDHDEAKVAAANRALEPLSYPQSTRKAQLRRLGLLPAKECR